MVRISGLRLLVAVVAVSAVLPRVAGAQVIRIPPRSAGGIFGGSDQPTDPNRTRSTLTATINAFGGWDDDLLTTEPGSVSTDPDSRVAGYLGVGSAAMRFWRGRTTRSFELNGRTHLTQYVDQDNIDPLFGGDGSASGEIRVGRRTFLTGSTGIGYTPSLTVAAYTPIEGLVDSGVVADGDPTRAVTELSSRTIDAAGGVRQDWTDRQRTQFRASTYERLFFEDTSIESVYQRGRGHSASIDHEWNFGRIGGLTGGYRYGDHTLREDTGFVRPTETHEGTVGFTVRKALTRTRTLALAVRGGATHVDTINSTTELPYNYVAPSGSGSVRLDLGRTWGVSADYRRDVSVLEGLALETFLTDATALTLGGNLNQRLAFATSFAFSQGNAQESEAGEFDSKIGTAQLQYELARWCSLVSSYTYYVHHMRDLTSVPEGFPLDFERNSVRVGISMNLPLYGNFGTAQRN